MITSPTFYHEHLLARGNPLQSYFQGAPTLQGPPLGRAFEAQGLGRIVPTALEMEAMVTGFRTVLEDSKDKDCIWEQTGCIVDTLKNR